MPCPWDPGTFNSYSIVLYLQKLKQVERSAGKNENFFNVIVCETMLVYRSHRK